MTSPVISLQDKFKNLRLVIQIWKLIHTIWATKLISDLKIHCPAYCSQTAEAKYNIRHRVAAY